MSAARETAPAVAMVTESVALVSDALARAKCDPRQEADGVTVARCPCCESDSGLEARRVARKRGATIACANGCDGASIASRLGLTPALGAERAEDRAPAPKKAVSATIAKQAPPTHKSLAAMVLPLSVDLLREAPPPRECLIRDAEGRGVMPRGRVCMLGAPGGTGKSKAVVSLSVAVATGGRWFGEWQCEQGRVLLVLAEEDRAEALRRLHFAQRTWSDADALALVENLTIIPAAGVGLALTYETDEATGALPETARVAELRKMLRDAAAEGRPYKLVVLDPSSRFAGADVEKDNAAATRYVQVLETLTAADCGAPNVLLPAHTRKRSRDDEPGSTDALRGSSGQRDGARWVAMLERRKLYDGMPKLLDLVVSKTNYVPESAIVLAADDDLEGSLRAATEDEIEQWAAAAGQRTQAARDERDTDVQARALAELVANGPRSGRKLADALHVRPDSVNAACNALKAARRITRRGGKNGCWEVIPGDSQVAPSVTGDTVNGGSALKGAGAGSHRLTHQGGASESPHPFGCRCAGDTCVAADLNPAREVADA